MEREPLCTSLVSKLLAELVIKERIEKELMLVINAREENASCHHTRTANADDREVNYQQLAEEHTQRVLRGY